MATRTKRGPNKTSFVRDFIQKNPAANRRAVEEAWLAAGNEGPISSALVSTTRSKLGLIANQRSGSGTVGGNGAPGSVPDSARGPKRKTRGRAAGGKAVGIVAGRTGEPTPPSAGRDEALAEVEAGIDRLIFKLIALGGLEEVEDELRKVRRLLYRSYSE